MNKVMRQRVGWSLIAFCVFGIVWGAGQQAPYVIESPGLVTNVLGKSDGVEILQGKFPAEDSVGAIDMLTVSGDGAPGSTPTWFEILAALFSEDRAIFPLELIFPKGTTFEEFEEESLEDLNSSTKSALIAAQTVLPDGAIASSGAKIVLEGVGGPSAGLAFALGLVDKLTPGSLTGGKALAVTGTIDNQGLVGEIGGIQQKIYGAKRNGDEFLLIPIGNCYDLTSTQLELIRVIPVRSLNQALAVVNLISADGDIDSLPTCSDK